MKKLSLHIILPLLIAFVAVTMITVTKTGDIITEAATLAQQKNQLGTLKDRYAEASKKAKEVRSNLEKTKNELKTASEKKKDIDDEITALTEQIKTAEFLVEEYESAIREKNTEKTNLELKKQEQFDTLGEMLRTSYMYGEESYIDLILGSKDIGDFLQRLDFISYHMKYSQTLMDEMDATAETLLEVTQTLETSYSAMTELITELEATKEEFNQKWEEAEKIIELLKKEEGSLEGELEISEKDTTALEDDIKTLEKQIKEEEERQRKAAEEERKKNNSNNTTTSKNTISQAPTSDNPAGDGQIIWPLKGYRPLTSSYGYRIHPISGQYKFHNGLDISAPHGTNIYAAESGKVIRASWYGGYGNCVMIDHGNGLITLYAHCSGYNVKNGQMVTQGDVIAFVGTTGQSTGNHLHFTMRLNGEYVDPSKYLPKR